MALPRLFVEIGAKIDGFEKAMGTVSQRLNAIDREAARAFSGFDKIGQRLTDVGTTLSIAVTAPILGAAGAATKFGSDFQSAMNEVRARGDITGESLQRLSELAIKLGADTKFSATQAAQGMAFLAAAGFDARQIFEAMPGVLSLAAAGGISVADAAKFAGDTLGQFGLAAGEATHVADILSKAANVGTGSLSDLATSLTYVGPVANSLGLSVEDTVAALLALDKAGIRGSEAGTGLRGVLFSLVSPSKESAEAMESLGVNIQDASGNFLPLPTILDQFNAGLAGTEGTVARNIPLFEIFGRNAGSAAQALVNMGGEGVGNFRSQLDNVGGAAKRTADILNSGLRGAVEELGGSIETAGIAFAQVLLPKLEAAAVALKAFVNDVVLPGIQWFKELPEPVQNFALGLAAVAAAAGPVLFIAGQLAGAVTTLAPAFTSLTGALLGGAAGAGPLAAILTGLPVVLSGVGVAVLALGTAWAAWKYQDDILGIQLLKAAIGTIWEVTGLFVGALKSLYTTATSAASSLGFLKPILDLMLAPIRLLVDGYQGLTGALKGYNDTLGTSASIWQQAASVITTTWMNVNAVLSALWNDAKRLALEVWGGVQSYLGTLWEGVTAPFVTAWEYISATLTSLWSGVSQTAFSAWEPVKTFFLGIWDGVSAVFTTAWDSLAKFLTGVWEVIAKAASDIWEWITNKINTALNGLAYLLPETTAALRSWSDGANKSADSAKTLGDNSSETQRKVDELKARVQSATGVAQAHALALNQSSDAHRRVKAAARESLPTIDGWSAAMKIVTQEHINAVNQLNQLKANLILVRVGVVDFDASIKDLAQSMGSLGSGMADVATIQAPAVARAIQAIDPPMRQIQLSQGELTTAIFQTAAAYGDLQTATDTVVPAMRTRWQGFGNEVSTIITNAAQGMAKALFDGDLSFGERFVKMAKSLGEAVVAKFIEPATAAIGKFIDGVLTDLLGGKGLGGVLGRLGDMGSSITGIFGGGASAGGQAVGSIGGVAGGAGSAGGGAASAASGIMGTLGVIGAIGSFASGVIGNFQMRGMGIDLGRIEESTRYTAIAMIGPGGVIDTERTFLPWLEIIGMYLYTVQQPWFVDVSMYLERMIEKLGQMAESAATTATDLLLTDIRGLIQWQNDYAIDRASTGGRSGFPSVVKLVVNGKELSAAILEGPELAGAGI